MVAKSSARNTHGGINPRPSMLGDDHRVSTWVLLAFSSGAIAAAFSGFFGAPDNAKIGASVGFAVLVPLVRWLFVHCRS